MKTETKSDAEFIKEYSALMKAIPTTSLPLVEWTKKGDMFKQFSLLKSQDTLVSPDTTKVIQMNS
ncbi:MAG: hypothetical protein ACOYXT_01205 [Bacteroidota bacterium]